MELCKHQACRAPEGPEAHSSRSLASLGIVGICCQRMFFYLRGMKPTAPDTMGTLQIVEETNVLQTCWGRFHGQHLQRKPTRPT